MTKTGIKRAKETSPPANGTQSAEIVTAKGNITIRLTAIVMAGVILLVLLLGGFLAFYSNPSQSKDLWLIIGPIISGAVSGLVGFQIGKKSKET
jgi:RsiW-degrading membrane proteinase PrsW (M82 family)